MSLAILFLPFLGAIIAGFFHTILGEKLIKYISVGCMFVSALFSWIVFVTTDFSVVKKLQILKWISSGDLNISWEIRLDALTAVMLVVICSVSFLVHLYSLGYMRGDYNWKPNESYQGRFFSYLSFFTFARARNSSITCVCNSDGRDKRPR